MQYFFFQGIVLYRNHTLEHTLCGGQCICILQVKPKSELSPFASVVTEAQSYVTWINFYFSCYFGLIFQSSLNPIQLPYTYHFLRQVIHVFDIFFSEISSLICIQILLLVFESKYTLYWIHCATYSLKRSESDSPAEVKLLQHLVPGYNQKWRLLFPVHMQTDSCTTIAHMQMHRWLLHRSTQKHRMLSWTQTATTTSHPLLSLSE